MLRGGRRLTGEAVVLYVVPSAGASRAAFVTSRTVGGAVVRNRARRLLREAWRAAGPHVKSGWDVVMVARTGIRGAGGRQVQAEVLRLLGAGGVIEE